MKPTKINHEVSGGTVFFLFVCFLCVLMMLLFCCSCCFVVVVFFWISNYCDLLLNDEGCKLQY